MVFVWTSAVLQVTWAFVMLGDGHELRPREPVHEQVTITGHDHLCYDL